MTDFLFLLVGMPHTLKFIIHLEFKNIPDYKTDCKNYYAYPKQVHFNPIANPIRVIINPTITTP